VRPTVRLLTATACLASLAVGTVAANAGLTPVSLAAVSSYLSAHGSSPAAQETAEGGVAGATPRAKCGPGSLPETGRQGRVPAADYESGRAAKGYTCNAEQVSHFGTTGGYKVFRYQDRTGRTCAYYDSTLLFPKDLAKAGTEGTGVYVLDMSDPARPVHVDTLRTVAMQSPHESLALNEKRGLLVAVMGYPTTNPGIVDVYDVSQDCRYPVLRSSSPLGILGHESGFSPDGRTYWVSSTSTTNVVALDLADPARPSIVWRSDRYRVHGMGVSDDGNRLYITDLGRRGVTILDVSEVQARRPDPQVSEVSGLTWPEASIGQNALPVTIKGKPYLVEVDEFARDVTSYDPASPVGAARIIDISDEKKPSVVSNLRLEVHQPAARRDEQRDDPQAQNGLQGYAGHYCAVPRRAEPGIVACSFILSGLRVFDIRNPERPREIAYFNQPALPGTNPRESGAYAMSAPAFDPARNEIWYSDGNSGFYNVRLTNGVWPQQR
jgi:hypothetical protein